MSIKSFFRRAGRLFHRDQNLHRLHVRAQMFGALSKMERNGLIVWDSRNRRLFIVESLAQVYISLGREQWQNFLLNASDYVNFTIAQTQAEQDRINAEMKAVRAAKRKHPLITKAEIERVRIEARTAIEPREKIKGQFEEFEFFIIRSNSYPSDVNSDTAAAEHEAAGHIISVGHINTNTGTLEMALWDDIKSRLTDTSEKK